MNVFRLEILTIERQLFDEEVSMAVVPTEDGVVGVMPNHQPMLAVLAEGNVIVRREGRKDYSVAIRGGVLQVLPDQVVVLADQVADSHETNL